MRKELNLNLDKNLKKECKYKFNKWEEKFIINEVRKI